MNFYRERRLYGLGELERELLAMMANSDPKQATSRNRVIMSISFVVYPRYGAIMLAGC